MTVFNILSGKNEIKCPYDNRNLIIYYFSWVFEPFNKTLAKSIISLNKIEIGHFNRFFVNGNQRERLINTNFVAPNGGNHPKNWKSFQIENLNQKNRKIGEHYELRISNVSREDEGIYECKIDNEQKFKANLIIKPVTVVTKAPSDVSKAQPRTSCIAKNADRIIWEKVNRVQPRNFEKLIKAWTDENRITSNIDFSGDLIRSDPHYNGEWRCKVFPRDQSGKPILKNFEVNIAENPEPLEIKKLRKVVVNNLKIEDKGRLLFFSKNIT